MQSIREIVEEMAAKKRKHPGPALTEAGAIAKRLGMDHRQFIGNFGSLERYKAMDPSTRRIFIRMTHKLKAKARSRVTR